MYIVRLVFELPYLRESISMGVPMPFLTRIRILEDSIARKSLPNDPVLHSSCCSKDRL